MAKYNIRALNYVTAGSKLNTFNIEYCYTNDGMILSKKKPDAITSAMPFTKTFFGDVGTTESMSLKYATNKAAFYNIDDEMIVHPLYLLERTKMVSSSKKDGTTENLDIYLPLQSADVIGICLNGNYAYGLTQETQKLPVYLSVVFNSNAAMDSSYHYSLSSDDIPTYLYPMLEELVNNSNINSYDMYVKEIKPNSPELSNSRLSSIFSISKNLNGINYNYLVEIPESTINNNYDLGTILCDMAITKNCHSPLYNMEISSTDFNLNFCREYCNINKCGDTMYLTYRDNVYYENVTEDRTITYYDNLDTEYDQISSEIKEYFMQKKKRKYSYLHVEVINSFDRFDGNSLAKHKPSMFSIRLKNTGLNESSIPDTIKLKLRQNITNNIRSIVDKICPAHTLLFNVYFEGD